MTELIIDSHERRARFSRSWVEIVQAMRVRMELQRALSEEFMATEARRRFRDRRGHSDRRRGELSRERGAESWYCEVPPRLAVSMQRWMRLGRSIGRLATPRW